MKSLRRKKDNKKMKIFIIKRIKKDYGKKAQKNKLRLQEEELI